MANVITTQSATTLAGDLHVLQATKDILDRWFFGVIILGADDTPLFMNKAAKQILDKGDSLVHRRDGLHAMFPGETAKLRNLMRSATVASSGRGARPKGGAIMLSRAAKRPLFVLVTALPLSEGSRKRSAGCAIFVSDPDVRADTDEGLLRSLYGLTAAEGKVAVLLVQGYDARSVSEKLAVSFHTARTHVRRVFEKTDTGRQAELVHLILCAPLSSGLKSVSTLTSLI